MYDIIVTCGCTRQMYPDSLRGAGAFRCGCGATAQIKISGHAQCTGLPEDGLGDCPLEPVAQAAQLGLSLCQEHYQALGDVIGLVREGRNAQARISEITEMNLIEIRRRRTMTAQEAADQDAIREAMAVVYYIRMRDTIKIGTTMNMGTRMPSLVPDEILATEPGSEPLERLRHKQFAHLRIRGERFRPEQDLLDHIEMIRKHYGVPVKVKTEGGAEMYTRADPALPS